MAGHLVRFEFPAQDVTRATRFYSSLFGWTFAETQQGGMEYHITEAGGEPSGAIFPSDAGERGPIVYFDAEDIDAALAQVRDLGGEGEDKQLIPGIGWLARCRDTEGNAFSLFEADESVTPAM